LDLGFDQPLVIAHITSMTAISRYESRNIQHRRPITHEPWDISDAVLSNRHQEDVLKNDHFSGEYIRFHEHIFEYRYQQMRQPQSLANQHATQTSTKPAPNAR